MRKKKKKKKTKGSNRKRGFNRSSRGNNVNTTKKQKEPQVRHVLITKQQRQQPKIAHVPNQKGPLEKQTTDTKMSYGGKNRKKLIK